MEPLEKKLSSLKSAFFKALEDARVDLQLEGVRITFLGRQGLLAQLMDTLKTLSLEEKRVYGPVLNQVKTELNKVFEAKKIALTAQAYEHEQLKKRSFDVTAYQPHQLQGSLHPYTKIIEHIENIFISMGFSIADGPEVETDYYNFKALNIPDNHPARDLHDTFWLDIPHLLLRTHTSPVQVRTMEQVKPPLALAAPGRCYRHEATDASHDYMFMQVEGLVVDKKISVAHLTGTVKTFLQALFGKALKVRLRPGYFPFVEPGIEFDISCPFCTQGCSTCKKTTWIEACGSGMVHPNVLRAGGIDPSIYSGFAFGFGLTRLAMLLYGINDIRLLHSNKLEFLKQF
jgi:phenylalanyl-tRNA synthetase alpha chain